MSFDLAIWVGDTPTNDHEARRTLRALMDRSKETDPVDPRLRESILEITQRYPDDLREMRSGSIWATCPLTPQGSMLYMNLTWGVSDDVLDFIAGTAAKHGLVCYDPQASAVVDPAHPRALHESRAAGHGAFMRFLRMLGWRDPGED